MLRTPEVRGVFVQLPTDFPDASGGGHTVENRLFQDATPALVHVFGPSAIWIDQVSHGEETVSRRSITKADCDRTLQPIFTDKILIGDGQMTSTFTPKVFHMEGHFAKALLLPAHKMIRHQAETLAGGFPYQLEGFEGGQFKKNITPGKTLKTVANNLQLVEQQSSANVTTNLQGELAIAMQNLQIRTVSDAEYKGTLPADVLAEIAIQTFLLRMLQTHPDRLPLFLGVGPAHIYRIVRPEDELTAYLGQISPSTAAAAIYNQHDKIVAHFYGLRGMLRPENDVLKQIAAAAA